MSSKKLYMALFGICGLLIVASLAAVYLGNNALKERSAKLFELKKEQLQLEEQQKILVQAKRDIKQYSEIESIAKTVVPQEKDQARTVRELVAIANRTGIKIANISFPSSTLGGDKKKSAGTTQLESVSGIPGVYQLEVNVQTDASNYVSFGTLLRFLQELEQNRRTAQVNNLTITPAADNRKLVTFNVILNVYIKP